MCLATNHECWLPAEPFLRWLEHVRNNEMMRLGFTEDAMAGRVQWHEDTYGRWTPGIALAQAVGRDPDHSDRFIERRIRRVWEQVEGPHGHGEWVERELVAHSLVDELLAGNGTYSIYDIYPQDQIDAVEYISTARDRRYCKSCGIELRDKGRICGFCTEEEGTDDPDERAASRPGTDRHPGAEPGSVCDGHVASGGVDRGRAVLRGAPVRPRGTRARGDVPGRAQALQAEPRGRRARSADRRRTTAIPSGG